MKEQNKSINNLLSEEWQLIVSFRTELFSEYLIEKNHYKVAKICKLPYLKRMYVDNDIYLSTQEILAMRKKISRSPLVYTNSIFRIIENKSKQFLDYSKKLIGLKFVEVDNHKLLQYLKTWVKYYEQAVSLIGVPFRLDEVLEEQVKEGLEEHDVKDKEGAFLTIAGTDRLSGTMQERIDLIRLVIGNKNLTSKLLQRKIASHAQKYQWINVTLLLGDLYDPKDVLKKIKKLKKNKQLKKELDDLRNSIQNNKKELLALKKRYQFKPLFLKKIRALRYAVWFRTARLDWINSGCSMARPMLIEAANRLNLSFEQLIYCFPEEIYSALEGKGRINNRDVSMRIKKYVMGTLNGKDIAWSVGDKVNVLKGALNKKIEKESTIRGVVAQRGVVRGKVKIILDRRGISEIKRGEILVTKLTTPDFMPAIEKSKAIITDLGGITSHAAIVSRELKRPCIVGTKIATKVLQDGDMVEVDADKGIVKKL